MSIGWGFDDPIWMFRAVINYAPDRYVKYAVCKLAEELSRVAEEDGEIQAFEILNMLVQYSATGEYRPNQEEVDPISEEDIEQWMKDLNIPGDWMEDGDDRDDEDA